MPSLSRNTRWLLVLLLATTAVVLTSNPLREIFHTASSSSDRRAGDSNLSPQDIKSASRATKSKRPSQEEALLAKLAAVPEKDPQSFRDPFFVDPAEEHRGHLKTQLALHYIQADPAKGFRWAISLAESGDKEIVNLFMESLVKEKPEEWVGMLDLIPVNLPEYKVLFALAGAEATWMGSSMEVEAEKEAGDPGLTNASEEKLIYHFSSEDATKLMQLISSTGDHTKVMLYLLKNRHFRIEDVAIPDLLAIKDPYSREICLEALANYFQNEPRVVADAVIASEIDAPMKNRMLADIAGNKRATTEESIRIAMEITDPAIKNPLLRTIQDGLPSATDLGETKAETLHKLIELEFYLSPDPPDQ